jgi:ribosomal protein S18 acetylase RimI-like enzyme
MISRRPQRRAKAQTLFVGQITVRKARTDDQPALQLVFCRASLDNPGDRAELLAHPEALQLSADLISEGRTRVATLADGTIVGFASTSQVREGSVELDDLFVDPDWQRRGAGRRLLEQVVAEASAERATRISVTANGRALDFYRNAGFEVAGRVETAFGVGTRMHMNIWETSRPERKLPGPVAD